MKITPPPYYVMSEVVR